MDCPTGKLFVGYWTCPLHTIDQHEHVMQLATRIVNESSAIVALRNFDFYHALLS